MLEWVWALVRWVHLVAMAIWLGGQLFLFLVVRPVLRSELDRPTQTRLTAAFGRRYSPLAWISLIVAILTGFAIGEHRGVAWSALVSFPSAYGTLLIMKNDVRRTDSPFDFAAWAIYRSSAHQTRPLT
jgi:putative copper resistance protein D